MLVYELSMDNHIEVLGHLSQEIRPHQFTNIFCALNHIRDRNYTRYMALYNNNETVARVLETHHTICDLNDILKVWDKGFNYKKEVDILEVRNFIRFYQDKLTQDLKGWEHQCE